MQKKNTNTSIIGTCKPWTLCRENFKTANEMIHVMNLSNHTSEHSLLAGFVYADLEGDTINANIVVWWVLSQ